MRHASLCKVLGFHLFVAILRSAEGTLLEVGCHSDPQVSSLCLFEAGNTERVHHGEKLKEEWHPWETAVGDVEEIWPLGLDGLQEKTRWKRGGHVGSNGGDTVE